MQVKVTEECIGCGMCEGLCPEVFRINDSGQAEAYETVYDENQELVQEAVDGCPVDAIEWVEK